MGGVEMTRPDGTTLIWRGTGDKPFMQELIGWLLAD